MSKVHPSRARAHMRAVTGPGTTADTDASTNIGTGGRAGADTNAGMGTGASADTNAGMGTGASADTSTSTSTSTDKGERTQIPVGCPGGCVYLVGAGPGDPGLLTTRALALIARADVVIHDRLIPTSALDAVKPEAELVFVGKQGGGPSASQPEIERMLIERAQGGAIVVRLKGGDPFVFGRGGEEALALAEAGIPFEVVSGVTAGVAASASAGIPVTHRGVATAVAFVTGHTRAGGATESDLDWPGLAAFPGTLVFYMGLSSLPEISSRLVAAGRPREQPAAVIEQGTLPGQRVATGTLADIAARVAEQDIKAPAITVIGEVVSLAAKLAPHGRGGDPAASSTVEAVEQHPAALEADAQHHANPEVPTIHPPTAGSPLAGMSVAVTRARAQASSLAERLEALGATVVQAPAIRIAPLEGPPIDPRPYDLVCLTSPNGAELLLDRIVAAGYDARSLAGATVAAIGPGTARALAERGIVADIVPERFVAEGLVAALAGVPVERALVARAAQARDALPDALRSRGAEVDVVALYETVAEPLSPQVVEQAAGATYATFTSSSTVRMFLQAAGTPRGASPFSLATRIVSIGPVTSATLSEHGLQVDVEATRHDIDGLLEALVADAGR